MNIIVIMSDTFRWDHVSGFHRSSQLHTPFLEAFSKKCVIFDDFFSGSIPTLPNRADLFTGKYRCMEGEWGPLPEELPTLAELITEAGYRTQLITNTPHLMTKNHWYQRGFQFAEWIRNHEEDRSFCVGNAVQPPPELHQPHEKTRHTYPIEGWNISALCQWMHARYQWEEDRLAPQTARSASKWLEWNYADGPFFLWVELFDPHEPWNAPEYLVKRFDPDYDGIPMTHPSYGFADVFTKKELFNLHAHYKASATFTDKWLGHVFQKIEDLGIMDDTVIVFLSDHGTYLGEHNRTGKDNHFDPDPRHWPVYEELPRVPFMLYHPKARPGRRVKGFAQPVDLTKTLLEIAKAKRPRDLHGMSLLPAILGKTRRGPRTYAVTSRTPDNTAVFTSQWTFQPFGEGMKPALYDRKADPLAKRNQFKKNGTEAQRLYRRIVKFFKDHGATDEIFSVIASAQV